MYNLIPNPNILDSSYFEMCSHVSRLVDLFVLKSVCAPVQLHILSVVIEPACLIELKYHNMGKHLRIAT